MANGKEKGKMPQEESAPRFQDFDGDELITLTDEEGMESDFSLLGQLREGDDLYVALLPAGTDLQGDGEYVILKMALEGDGQEVLVTIDDDDEFDRISDRFTKLLFSDE